MKWVDKWVGILFDSPPGAEFGRFIEVPYSEINKPIKTGKWIKCNNGPHTLRIPLGFQIMDRDTLANSIMMKLIEVKYSRSGSLMREQHMPKQIAAQAYNTADAMIAASKSE